MILILLLTNTTLTAVAAYELTPAGEFVDGKTTVIGTSVAVGHGGSVFQLIDLGNGKHSSLTSFCMVALLGNEGSTESTHNTGNVRTNSLTACYTLKASKYTVVVEGSALHYNMTSQLFGIGNLDNLVKRILDNRICKTCGNISYGCAFLLGLLYLGVHKYGTSCSKVNRVFCKKGSLGEILYGVVQGLGKGFDKGTTAGGTCLVQLYTVYGLITDLDTFHILSADIYNTVNLRVEESCCIVMGNGLNFAFIQQQSSLHQRLAVTCGTGKCNVGILWKNAVDLLDRTDGCLKRASVIIAVEGVKQGPVLTYKSSLGGGGACIDTQIAVSVILGKIALLYLIGTLTLIKCLIVFLRGKKRLHTFYLEIQFDGVLQAVCHICKGNCYLILRIHSRTHSCEKMGIFRCDSVLVIQLQGTDKGSLQLIQKVKGTTEKCNMAANRLAAGKTGNGLVYNCLENGSGKILLGGTIVDQRLDVSLGKYTAAGCDGVKRFVILRVFVQPGGICLKQGCHLIDERTGTSCADTIHTLFNIAAFEVDDLGILTAKLDGNISLGRNLLKRSGYRNYLLYKRNAKVVGECKSAGACDHRMKSKLSKFAISFRQKLCQCFLDVGEMTLVICEKQGVVFIKYCNFDSGGTNVNS